MTTLIGYRWKGSNVRSRVVLIARQACAHARPLLRKGTDDDLYFFLFYDTLFNTIRAFFLYRILFHSCQRYCGGGRDREHPDPKLRWPWRRGPPLTIPNREVKTVCADGTAIPSGRVGSRLFRKPLTEM